VSGRLLLGAAVVLVGAGCQPAPKDPPVNAVQEAFREGELGTRESEGRRVFVQRCATCHGPEGRGDGQNAYNLQPPPPDFRESLPELAEADRRRVIRGGTAALGRSALCPPWGRTLSESEIEAVLAYLEVTARPSAEEEEASGPGRRRWRR
jgi:mono/diheme cytochrome c family protein